MDPRHTGEILKHLEKQNGMLVEAYNSMSHELHKLQVEEEMLMRKFYELMEAQGLNRKKESNVSQDGPVGHSNALLANDSNASNGDGRETGHSTALTATTNEQKSLPNTTEEVYLVPLGGYVDQNQEQKR